MCIHDSLNIELKLKKMLHESFSKRLQALINSKEFVHSRFRIAVFHMLLTELLHGFYAGTGVRVDAMQDDLLQH